MSDRLHPVLHKAAAHETPYFLISRDQVVRNFRDFASCFPGCAIHYAMKANAEVEVLRTLADVGSGFEVASIHELELLKQLGVSGDRIIYGTSVKPAKHIRGFAEYGATTFTVDSATEVQKIASIAPRSHLFVRVSVDDSGSAFRFSEKFGTTPVNAARLFELARELGLQPLGVSFHVGSQAHNPRAWAGAIAYIEPLFAALRPSGIELTALNIGGGFPCCYASSDVNVTLEEIAEPTVTALRGLPGPLRLIAEPGRALVANAALLVASVIGRVERDERTWLFMDAGVYNGLFEIMAYQGSIRYRVSRWRPPDGKRDATFAIAGPTGNSPDVVTREVSLPADTDVGDRLVFHDVGAYSLVTCCPFNGFPKPPVYYI